MKCVVLAGGSGERLWPLSRKNCPKQFIKITNNHSIFQDTIARNIPYCDEFIIVTNKEYRCLVENQLAPFQGLNYRCIYEEVGKKTTAAIILACLSFGATEYVLVTNTNLLISAPEYKEAVLSAKQNAYEGYLSILVKKEKETDCRYGYVIKKEAEIVKEYIEKPQEMISGEVYKNLGILIFQNGVFLNSISKKEITEYKKEFAKRKIEKSDTYYSEINVQPISVENAVLESVHNLKAVEIGFEYQDIRTLEDLKEYENQGTIINNSERTQVINTEKNKAIVVNDIEDLLVVNTRDALYIGKNGVRLKGILQKEELVKYAEHSTISNRPWGYHIELSAEDNYRLRKVVINTGKTIYQHVHKKRTESWTILKGKGKFTLNGEEKILTVGENTTARPGENHQISNVGEDVLILIESAIGDIIHEDMSATSSKQTTEKQLGLKIDPMIKLKPALKDYLWGGTLLKEKYGVESDLDVVAEAWELSAHPDGESIVSSGRHKGLTFSKYIEKIGKEMLGWKCSPLQSFPMLVKFIDAKGNLSIQVHPDDDYALEHENQYGKNEMWYVIDSKPGSGLYVGFNKDVDREEVERRVKNNTITDILNFYPTKAGDIFFIPAGTVHAICEGNLICEIQQSSNCTYRLYDYDRRDKFGNPRELHLKKALDVLNYNQYEAVQGNINCKYFAAEIFEVKEKKIRLNEESFLSIICLDGKGKFLIDEYELDVNAGDSIFVLAQKGILKTEGKMRLAVSHI